jgi:hypothetical protein
MEEPELSVIRDSDAAEYPSIGEFIEDARFLEHLRLWARNGMVSSSEARAVNQAFDAVMVHTRLDVARNVRSWFDGTVFFRHFGELPWVAGDPNVNDGSVDHAGIHYVPLLPSLAGTPLAATFESTLVLRSTLPLRSYAVRGATSGDGPPRIGLFVEKIEDVARIGDWVCELARGLVHGDVVVFGLEASARDALGSLPPNVTTPPRLPELEYRDLFASLTALIYPYGNPRHIHYVPYEAVALGIPVFTLQGAPIAVDLLTVTGSPEIASFAGVCPDPESAVAHALDGMNDRTRLNEIRSTQRAVLDLLSSATVLSQARDLRRVVQVPEREGAEGACSPFKPRVVMPPCGGRVFPADAAPGHSISIAPAAVVTSSELGEGAHVVFHEHGAQPGYLVPRLLPGKSHFLRLGMPASLASLGLFVRVTLLTNSAAVFPAELTTIEDSGGSRWSNFIAREDPSGGGEVGWSAVSRVGPRDVLRITVFGDQIDAPIDLHGIVIDALSEVEWWGAREQALLQRVVELQRANEHLANYGEHLEREVSELRLAAEEAGEWGADLERQLLASRTVGRWRRLRTALRRK